MLRFCKLQALLVREVQLELVDLLVHRVYWGKLELPDPWVPLEPLVNLDRLDLGVYLVTRDLPEPLVKMVLLEQRVVPVQEGQPDLKVQLDQSAFLEYRAAWDSLDPQVS